MIVGDDGASSVYVNNKTKAAQKCGITGTTKRLGKDTTQQELLDLVDSLNKDKEVRHWHCLVGSMHYVMLQHTHTHKHNHIGVKSILYSSIDNLMSLDSRNRHISLLTNYTHNNISLHL